ncbi:MAG: hypothetical protein C0515_08055 [Novosphingobium sp.]|nr:hypothetical protein [Novosphingobium sp.]MBX9642489.1 hypothetical protein [Novosphingobium sp.]
MKVAVSIPDDVFTQGEAAARRLRLSRSKLYARALKEFAERNDPDAITDSINAAIDAGVEEELEFVRRAARHVAARSEW